MKKYLILSLLLIASPNLFAQWEPCSNGLSDSTITCLKVKGNFLFAGTDRGIYLSANNGDSWVYKNNRLTIYSLAISGNNVFVGTWGDGIYLSTDNGNSWVPKNSGLTISYIHSIVISGNNICSGTSNGIFLSTDNGDHWDQKNNGLIDTVINSIAISDNEIFAGTNGGVYLSTDNGNNWIQKNNGLTNFNIFTIAYIGGNIFAVNYTGIYLSTDNGDHWVQKDNGLHMYYFSSIRSIVTSGNSIFVGTDNGVFLSTNNGDNWVHLKNNGLPFLDIYSIAINSNYIFAGSFFGGGIYRAKLSDLLTDVNEQMEILSNISISPNPTTDFIEIKGLAENENWEIFNVLGEKVLTNSSDDLKSSDESRRINISGFQRGIYFVRMGNRVAKFVKI